MPIENKIFHKKMVKNICTLLAIVFIPVFIVSCSTVQNVSRSFNMPLAGDLKEIKIYLTKSKGPDEISFVSVGRKVQKEDSIVDSALKELFLGPTKNEELRGIMTEIPEGTRLIKVEESEDEILIDLSSQYLSGGGSATMQLRYLQLYKTLNNIAPGKKIYFQVDGKNIKSIGQEGLEITQPLTKIGDYTQKPKKTDMVQP